MITLSCVGSSTLKVVSNESGVSPSNNIEAPLIVNPAPTSVPPADIPPVVFNCSLPKSIVPLAEVIEEVPICMFAISAVVATSIVDRPVKFVFNLVMIPLQ